MTRVAHGLDLLVTLAQAEERHHITLAEVAANTNVSVSYLEQIAAILRKAGVIRGVRGPRGGYYLARQPHEISLATVVARLSHSTKDTIPRAYQVLLTGIVGAATLEQFLSAKALMDELDSVTT